MNQRKAKRIRREMWSEPTTHDFRQHLLRSRRYVALKVKKRMIETGQLDEKGNKIYQEVKFYVIGNDPKSARATYLRAKRKAA
jgi:hypothetical protein